MYAYVFGPEWEDILYFSDFQKGYAKLELYMQKENMRAIDTQTSAITWRRDSFSPILIGYEDEEGALVERDVWKIKEDGTRIIQTTADREWGC